MESSQSRWSNRFMTLRQALRILNADWRIRFQSMSRWQDSLGWLQAAPPSTSVPLPQIASDKMRTATAHARRTERAADRLPYSPKCLPQAMALQWSLRSAGIASSLVVAMRKQDAEPPSNSTYTAVEDSEAALVFSVEDRYHAWVQCGDVMLIGQCERSEYRPVFSFENSPKRGPAVIPPLD